MGYTLLRLDAVHPIRTGWGYPTPCWDLIGVPLEETWYQALGYPQKGHETSEWKYYGVEMDYAQTCVNRQSHAKTVPSPFIRNAGSNNSFMRNRYLNAWSKIETFVKKIGLNCVLVLQYTSIWLRYWQTCPQEVNRNVKNGKNSMLFVYFIFSQNLILFLQCGADLRFHVNLVFHNTDFGQIIWQI